MEAMVEVFAEVATSWEFETGMFGALLATEGRVGGVMQDPTPWAPPTEGKDTRPGGGHGGGVPVAVAYRASF